MRKQWPTLSLRGLHTVLTVAAAPSALTYNDVAATTGQSYSSTSIQLALLSDGRGQQRGLGLVLRVSGDDRRQKKVLSTSAGSEIAKRFLDKSADANLKSGDYSRLHEAVIPALRLVLDIAPDITLGTFCVLLYIVQNNVAFGLEGSPSVTISRDIGIANLPRHLANLSTGSGAREGLGFVEMIADEERDRRVVVPAPTSQGLRLVASVAAAVQQKSPSPIKTPKPDRLAQDASVEDVALFEDDDFDIANIFWENDDAEGSI